MTDPQHDSTGRCDTWLICPLTASDVDAMRRQMLSAADQGADAVECRLDFLDRTPGETELRQLLADAPVPVIVTCRPKRQGGRFDGPEPSRLAVLHQAARMAPAFVDVEMDVPPAERPDAPTILSHHDFDGVPADLDTISAAMDQSDAPVKEPAAAIAAVKKVVFAAGGPEDSLRALDILRASPKPTIALAMGEAGVASRILARKFGAMGTFGALAHGAESAPGQPTLAELRDLYRWDRLGPDTIICGVIGCPVGHSMSPAIHNAAFAAAGIDAVYVPLLIQPGAENFNRFLDAVAERPWLHWRGLSVTIPHKENALTYVGAERCDELAVRIGAVNTVTMQPDGTLRGDNTDYAAAIDSLCDAMAIARDDLKGRSVAVLGAGGASRAIVAALAHYGAAVTIYNRTVSRAEKLADDFSCPWAPLDHAARLDARIVINCTPIGMHPNVDASPLASIPSSVEVVFDTIYNPIETKLLSQATATDRRTVSGLEMFVRQAVAQFEIWTRAPAPRPVMRRVVIERLGG